MTQPLPSTQIHLQQSGASTTSDSRGMREMQARAYRKRGAQYLLIKSPPASGKSRALMFIALDKLHEQGIGKAVIVVPERSIGSSFSDTALSEYGPDWDRDWTVAPRWNLCNNPGADEPRNPSLVKAVGEFLNSEDRILVCTHATFRFAFEEIGVDAFDDCLLAVDEFHHVSTGENNVLGAQLGELIKRGKAHIVAMTGSYFRGDAVPILRSEDEQKFETVVYTYFEQLNGYEHLKTLSLEYAFYGDGDYLAAVPQVIDPSRKTIVHIPSVNSRASTKDKLSETNTIMSALGDWQGVDPDTGFHLVKTAEGRVLKIADLVDDQKERDRVAASLKDPRANKDRDWVDIIIALGMAKEGFDWIWCEHALTVGYRSSLTEVVQIIGRATRDAPGKTEARFTNLIAEPAAEQGTVADAINDTLKAIAASLLMEQVLIPNTKFVPKHSGKSADPDMIGGVREVRENGQAAYEIEVNGLLEPQTEAGRKASEPGAIKDMVAALIQDQPALEQSLFNPDSIPEETTVLRAMNVIRQRNPDLPPEDEEAVRQRVIATMNLLNVAEKGNALRQSEGEEIKSDTKLLDGVRKYVTDVRELDVDLIDSINPFDSAYRILSVRMDAGLLEQLQSVIRKKTVRIDFDEARALALRAVAFKEQNGRVPSITAADPWERKMAEGVAAFTRFKKAEIAKADGL